MALAVDVEDVTPIAGRSASEDVLVKFPLRVVHTTRQPAAMVVTATADVHRDHDGGEVDLRSGERWCRPLHAFLGTVPLDVVSCRMIQGLCLHMQTAFCRADRLPDAGPVFGQPHRQALHFGSREEAEVGHFPPPARPCQRHVMESGLNVPRILSVRPRAAQVRQPHAEDGRRFTPKRSQPVGVGQFSKQQQRPSFLE